jgi:hypothetical protein
MPVGTVLLESAFGPEAKFRFWRLAAIARLPMATPAQVCTVPS